MRSAVHKSTFSIGKDLKRCNGRRGDFALDTSRYAKKANSRGVEHKRKISIG
jgi:hypothetical protein